MIRADLQELAQKLSRQADVIEYSLASGGHLTACEQLRELADIYSDLAAECAIEAIRDGRTQKQVAAALGVSSRTLSGIRQEAGVA